MKTILQNTSANIKNSIRDARTPQPGEIAMRYRISKNVQRLSNFQISDSYKKVQTMFRENNVLEKENACKDKVLKEDNSSAR